MESIRLSQTVEALDRIIEALYEQEEEMTVSIELAYRLREELVDTIPDTDDDE